MNPQNDSTNAANATGNGLSLPPVAPAQSQPASTPNPDPVPSPVVDAAGTPAKPVPLTNIATEVPQATADDAAPLIADDADLIEKAWVEKAKQLVEQTKNDPYKQNKEINKFKADYIKKRYNKDIQLSKD